MEKTATLNLRVNPDVKKQAEEVLDRLGIPMSTAINMYLNQIGMTQGIPFAVTIPKAPMSINADALSADEIHKLLDKGYRDAFSGKIETVETVFSKFAKRHNI